jgi:hypothetical protein
MVNRMTGCYVTEQNNTSSHLQHQQLVEGWHKLVTEALHEQPRSSTANSISRQQLQQYSREQQQKQQQQQ